MPANRDALSEWSQQHDGYDPARSFLVRGWLQLMHALAPSLVRRGVSPNAISVAGVATAAGASLAPPFAAPLVLLTALCDGLDGAVALQRGHSSRHGALIDHTADRVTDVLFAAALMRAGAHRWAAAADAAAVVGYEATRSWMRRKGKAQATVTVGERPMRVVVTAVGVVAGPTKGAIAVGLMAAGGLLQLLRPWSGVRGGD